MIFISYARRDGSALATRLCADLGKAGLDPWLDTRRLDGGATWTKEIERALDGSEAVLALLTEGSFVSEICRAEQLRALRKGKRVIPLMAQRGSDVPLHLESKNYRDFSEAYEAPLAALLQDIRGGSGGVALKPEFRRTYVTAPPLPRNYVERQDAIGSLRNALIADGSGASIALTALEGMGGIGKTVLAQALCHDEVVQQAFPDGVVWVTAGRESTYDVATRMREVRRALGDNPGERETELECINRYRTALQEKAALIVVDDVWRASDIEPFRAESPRSRLLFTTRDASIAAAVGADEHTAGLPTEEQSREVLARWSGLRADRLPSGAGALVRECGRLPLALSMIGAMLRGEPEAYWKHVRKLLEAACLAKSGLPGDLQGAMQVSVDALNPKTRERYLSLAVLLEDMTIHPTIQRTLWNADEGEALETAKRLRSLSLAQRDGDSIRLHDLQLDYVRAQYPDRGALELIHNAVRLSGHVIAKDPSQFASQLLGRLSTSDFTAALAIGAPRPFLRPLHATLIPPGTGLRQTLEGHSGWVNGVSVSEDGRRAVSASDDGTLKVWDVEAGRELRTLTGHSGPVLGVWVSADGRRAVSASGDRTLKVWDVEGGREVRTLEGHTDGVRGVWASADGRLAVSASEDRTLKLWDVESGRERRTLEGHAEWVRGVWLSEDGRLAVSASEDRTLKVWDVEGGRELRTLGGHAGGVNGVGVSADGRRAVSASEDGTLKLWDLESGCETGTLEGHSDPVYGVGVSGDGRLAVSAADDRTLKVWDLESGRQRRTLEGHSDPVNAVWLSRDGRLAVSASTDQTLKVWAVEAGPERRALERHSLPVMGVRVSGNGQRAVSASMDRTLKLWDVESGRELRTLEGHSDWVEAVWMSEDGRRAVSASDDQTLKVWDLESGRELRTLEGHSARVKGVWVSGDGRRAVSASWDRTLKVWDVESGRERRTLAGHSGPVLDVWVSADSRRAVSASWDQTLKVWDVEGGRELRTLEGHSGPVNGVWMSADGRRAISASDDQTLKLWNVESGRELRTLEGHSDRVTGVSGSADGRRAVSASEDQTLKVWNVDTGETIATFTCDSPLWCCGLASSNVIVAGDEMGRVHFLRLEDA